MPWARSFCPFRACGAYLRNLSNFTNHKVPSSKFQVPSFKFQVQSFKFQVQSKMNYKIILASNSPRRKELLAGLDIPFEVKVIKGIDESYPETLDAYEVAEYISSKKAEAYRGLLDEDLSGKASEEQAGNPSGKASEEQAGKASEEQGKEAVQTLILTADTVVIAPTADEQNDQEGKGVILGKPKDEEDAVRMLRMLSGKTHHVVTGVCLTTRSQQRHFSVITEVTFKHLSDAEISYYISHYKPFDKAGAYGIQEWIGYVGCTGLKGSYFNVMGLPVQRIYEEIASM